MSKYTTYQCSICRRQKDIIQDNIRALPNRCIITKGCNGSLYPIGETHIASDTPPVNGLTDWYQRGKKPIISEALLPASTISMSCAENGTLTLALLLSDVEAISNQTVKAKFKQRLSADVSYVEYQYNISDPITIISGKDINGKSLRFDQSAIDNNQIIILVNGVQQYSSNSIPSNITLQPNIITFNTSLTVGSVVEVSIYTVPPSITIDLLFKLNASNAVSQLLSGSWGNIKWVDEYNQTTGQLISSETGKHWWLYSCTSLSELSIASSALFLSVNSESNSQLIPSGLDDYSTCRFLLAAPPHDPTDRYLNFYIDTSKIASEYLLSSTATPTIELYAADKALIEIYPPLHLVYNNSFISPDVNSTTDKVSTDNPETRLTGNKILGPV